MQDDRKTETISTNDIFLNIIDKHLYKDNQNYSFRNSSVFSNASVNSLEKKGAKINYYDPSGKKNEFSKFKNVDYSDNINDACYKADLVIIHTEWEEFKALDFKKLNKGKKFKIYDLRNLYSVKLMKKKGYNYFSIGR